MGTAVDFFLARVQAVPFSGRDFLTMLTLSRALFAINVAVQFPLLIRFGYAQVSVLAITLPVAVVMYAVLRAARVPVYRGGPGLAPADWRSRRADGGVRGRGHHRPTSGACATAGQDATTRPAGTSFGGTSGHLMRKTG
jgi:hypothetical protein